MTVKGNNDIYQGVAKRLGLSDCAFWILYCLRSTGSDITQADICYALDQSKQTINSAIKKLERDGYIELSAGSDRRRKIMRLTDKGMQLAHNTVDRVFAAWLEALSELADEEQDELISMFHSFTERLERNTRGKNRSPASVESTRK